MAKNKKRTDWEQLFYGRHSIWKVPIGVRHQRQMHIPSTTWHYKGRHRVNRGWRWLDQKSAIRVNAARG